MLCKKCHGSGTVTRLQYKTYDYYKHSQYVKYVLEKCDVCGGNGKYYSFGMLEQFLEKCLNRIMGIPDES